jgi:hypothetical protein
MNPYVSRRQGKTAIKTGGCVALKGWRAHSGRPLEAIGQQLHCAASALNGMARACLGKRNVLFVDTVLVQAPERGEDFMA